MNLLILGGTAFVGRHLAACALARGHAVTLFNRGKQNPGLFPEAEHLVGDRDGGLAALENGRWDAVIDVSGYFPRLVKASAAALAHRVGRYVFISTISVYDAPAPGADEGAAFAVTDDPEVEEMRKETYGALKVRCEDAVRAIYGDRSLIVRPGIIAGPHDPTGRFTYWAAAMARGGDVLAPAPADAPLQVVDARDLADWTLSMVERDAGGTFNVVGPSEPVTRAAFLAAIRPVDVATRVGWVAKADFEAEGVDPGAVFPFYTSPENAGVFALSAARAHQSGLTLRPLAETAADTLASLATEPDPCSRYGLSAEVAARLALRADWRHSP